tara:strand:- start:254 stop:1069 length:816 start_codon:yes stop_codon:yes gene_type:complete
MPSNKSTKTKTKRKRKSKKTTKAAAVTAAPATASVEQTAPVVNETTSATSVADDAVTAVTEVVVEDSSTGNVVEGDSTPVVDDVTVVETNSTADANQVTVEATSLSVTQRALSLCDSVKGLTAIVRALQKEATDLRKDVQRQSKQLEKLQNSKNRTKRKTNHRSGIMQPHPIAKKLLKFMHSVSEKSTHVQEYSRVDVLKAVSKYVKEKGLQDTNNARFIELDSKLARIFPNLKGKTGTDRLQFTSVMTNIAPHFPPKKVKGASASAPVSS